jgi:hypothetical protein
MELVSTDAAFPDKLNQPGPSAAVLVPLVNQFSLMQQQMFDQFQQAMGMLVQMFGTMHREQMDVIREELARLHQLSDELQALKSELETQSKRSTQRSGQRAGALAGLDRRAAAASNARAELSAAEAAGGNPSHVQDTALVDESSVSDQPLLPPTDTSEHRPLLDTGFVSPLLPASPPSTPLLEQPQLGLGSQGEPDVGAVDSDRDTLVWLHQRIAILQHERESRWQKILKLLPGAS